MVNSLPNVRIYIRVPNTQGKQGKLFLKSPYRGKTLEILPKTQGKQGEFCLLNFLILKIQDIAIFAATFPNLLKSVLHMKSSQISEIGTGKISSWTDISNCTGKTEEIYKKNLSVDPAMYILPCPL